MRTDFLNQIDFPSNPSPLRWTFICCLSLSSYIEQPGQSCVCHFSMECSISSVYSFLSRFIQWCFKRITQGSLTAVRRAELLIQDFHWTVLMHMVFVLQVPLQDFQMRPRRPLNMNHYANKKSVAQSMLDVALLMANASQLKAVLKQGPAFSFYTPLIILISISLALQILVGIMLIFIGRFVVVLFRNVLSVAFTTSGSDSRSSFVFTKVTWRRNSVGFTQGLYYSHLIRSWLKGSDFKKTKTRWLYKCYTVQEKSTCIISSTCRPHFNRCHLGPSV